MIIACSITYCNGACQGFNKKKKNNIIWNGDQIVRSQKMWEEKYYGGVLAVS